VSHDGPSLRPYLTWPCWLRLASEQGRCCIVETTCVHCTYFCLVGAPVNYLSSLYTMHTYARYGAGGGLYYLTKKCRRAYIITGSRRRSKWLEGELARVRCICSAQLTVSGMHGPGMAAPMRRMARCARWRSRARAFLSLAGLAAAGRAHTSPARRAERASRSACPPASAGRRPTG
jgi:hypothetical protein